MDQFWNHTIGNNSWETWLIALLVIAVSVILLRLIQSVIVRKIHAFTARTKTTMDDFILGTIQSSVMPLLYALAVYLGFQYLQLPARVQSVVRIGMMVVLTFFLLRIASSFVAYTFGRALLRRAKSDHHEKQSKGILLILQMFIWMIGVLFLIDNLGYDITTIIAGLGIGGIAIALAAQTILGDLFSYLVIFFDKPFEVGDFIIMDDKMGTVENIGIKTTRIRTLSGEQLVCSNTDLTNSRVHNYKRMQERRVVFTFGVVYHTAPGSLKKIPLLVKEIIEGLEGARFDRAHFQSFGDFSLSFEVVYYVLSADYNTYMDAQQQINLQLVDRFEQEQIEFAFPTQTLMLRQVPQPDAWNG